MHTETELNPLDRIREHFSDTIQTLITTADTLSPQILKISKKLVDCLVHGHKIFTCGNGSAALDAQRFAAYLIHKFEVERPSLPAIALPANISSLTAISNDETYAHVFSKPIEALAQPEDVLLIFSTHGQAENLINAAIAARQRGTHLIVLSGQEGGKLSKLLTANDLEIKIPSAQIHRVQETQVLILHVLCDLIDRQLFGMFS